MSKTRITGRRKASPRAGRQELLARLEEAEETLRAIREGKVDAVVVSGPQGQQVYTLRGADHIYRVLLETMSEGAVVLNPDGGIIYSNRRFAELCATPLEQVQSSSVYTYFSDADRQVLERLIGQGLDGNSRGQVSLCAANETLVPVFLAITPLFVQDMPLLSMVVTDLTTQRQNRELQALAEERRQLVMALEAERNRLRESEARLRRVAEDAEKANALLSAVVASTDDAIYAKDILGRYVVTNPAAARLSNKTIEQILGYTDREVHKRDLAKQFEWEDQRVLETGEPLIIEYELIENGELRRYHTIKTPYRDAEGRMIGVVGVSRDITELKRAEQALQESNTLLHAVVEGTLDGIYAKDLLGRYVLANRAGAAFSGLAPEDLYGKTDLDIFPADTASEFMADDRRVIESGRPGLIENTVPFPDGIKVLQSIKSPYLDAQGNIIGVVGVSRDITPLKQAEAALRESERRFRLALRGSSIEVFNQDTNLRYTWLYNGKQGLTIESVVGKTDQELLSPEDAAQIIPLKHAVLTTGEPQHAEVSRGAGEDTLYFEVFLEPLLDRQENITGLAGVAIEITERKQAEHERERLLEQAQEAIRIRDQFFTVASHELKTPLTSMMGYAEILDNLSRQQTDEDALRRRAVHIIFEQTQRLNRMITAMLDVSRIQTGRLSLDRAPLDIGALTRRVIDDILPGLTRHTLELSTPTQPLMVDGDELRLEQVLQNLLQNAIKYSPRGGTIRVQVEPHGEMAAIAVIDEGIGIPNEAVPSLFERFYRAHNVESWHITGMGIGLYIVREVLAMHGGRVEVSSREGIGSTFTALLPLLKQTG